MAPISDSGRTAPAMRVDRELLAQTIQLFPSTIQMPRAKRYDYWGNNCDLKR
jgi:hypothetical protein